MQRKSSKKRPVRRQYDSLFESLPEERKSVHLRVILRWLISVAAGRQPSSGNPPTLK